MGIPKLKLYRISKSDAIKETEFSIADIQHAQGDELLPFVPKELNAYTNARKLVGIERVPDDFLRVVHRHQGSTSALQEIKDGYIRKIDQILVNGWILGQNNLEVLYSSNSQSFSDSNFVPQSQFRYELRTQKMQGYDVNGNKKKVLEEIDEYHDDLYMTIYIGQPFFTTRDKNASRYYKIRYAYYSDLDAGGLAGSYANTSNNTAFTSNFGLNRGDIYNGTKTGVFNDIPGIMNFDNPNASIQNHYYEGNYYYQIKYYPLRVKWFENNTARSVEWMPEGGIDTEWAKPQVFEIRKNPDGRDYYQKLTSDQCAVEADGNKRIITFKDAYNGKYPKNFGVAYNFTNDRIDVGFKQDYQYSNSANGSNLNRGVVFSDTGKIFDTIQEPNSPESPFLIKRVEKLAVQANYGYENQNDLLLTVGTDAVSFPLPSDMYGTEFTLYENGIEISNSLISQTGNIVSLNCAGREKIDYPKDLMIAYNKKIDIDFTDVCGLRAVASVKMRTTDTFVSSHPMWVTNHLNQSPDVFVGNTIYSGTSTKSYNSQGISPHYIEHDEYALSPDVGVVVLKNEITQVDYNYVINFVTQVNNRVSTTSTLSNSITYLNHVSANYAYYDGIYLISGGKFSCYTKQGGCHYAILDDPLFDLYCNKKFVALGDESGFYKSFYKGDTELPKTILKKDTSVSTMPITTGSYNFSNNRIIVIGVTNQTVFQINYTENDSLGITMQLASNSTSGKSLIFTMSNEGNFSVSGSSIWNIQTSGDNKVIIPPFAKCYDMVNDNYSREAMQMNMPTIKYGKNSWIYDVCFEVFNLTSSGAYIAAYRKMKGNE